MSENKDDQVEIQLTPDQQALVEKATGRKSATLSLSRSELEERIAPFTYPKMGPG